jgi:hypothetical protein
VGSFGIRFRPIGLVLSGDSGSCHVVFQVAMAVFSGVVRVGVHQRNRMRRRFGWRKGTVTNKDQRIMMRVIKGRMVSDSLPSVGDQVQVEHYGQAKVALLYHDSSDNWISLLIKPWWQDQPALLSFRFEVVSS